MKKFFTILLAMLMLCAAFVGCTPAQETEPSGTTTVPIVPTDPTDPTDPTEPTENLIQVSYEKTFYIIDNINNEILEPTTVVIEGWLDSHGNLDGYMNVEAYPISREYMDGVVSMTETTAYEIFSCQMNDYFYPEVEGFYIIFIAKEDPSLAMAYIFYQDENIMAVCADSEEDVWDNYYAYLEIFRNNDSLESE